MNLIESRVSNGTMWGRPQSERSDASKLDITSDLPAGAPGSVETGVVNANAAPTTVVRGEEPITRKVRCLNEHFHAYSHLMKRSTCS